MNQTRQYIRVGVALVAVLVLGIFAYGWLSGWLVGNRTIEFNVEFKDARGLTKGAPVTMAGVQIGSVEDVRLGPDNTAVVRLRVDKDKPIPSGSKFLVASSLLGGTPVLRVEPARESAGTIGQDQDQPGSESGSLESAYAQSEQLIQSLQRTATAVEKLATDPALQRDLRETVRNVNVATAQFPRLSRQAEAQLLLLSRQSSVLLARSNALLAQLQPALQSGVRTARNAEGLSRDLRATLNENRASVRSLVASASETVSAVQGITESVNETLQSGKIQNNLVAASDNLKAVSDRLQFVAGNIEQLTSDPALAADIQETVANLKETSASVRSLAARIETIHIPGERRPGGGAPRPAPTPAVSSLLELGPVVDSLYDTDQERLRLDADYTLLGGAGRFYRVGIYDLTETNRFNFQLGQTNALPGGTALRYGLVAGKLGAGLDTRVGPLDLRLDLFDPNRLTLNVRAKARLGEATSALIGVDSLGNGNRALLGVQIRR